MGGQGGAPRKEKKGKHKGRPVLCPLDPPGRGGGGGEGGGLGAGTGWRLGPPLAPVHVPAQAGLWAQADLSPGRPGSEAQLGCGPA